MDLDRKGQWMPESVTESTSAQGVWIDLCNPDENECRRIRERYGVTVPDETALREIESSSRLRADGEILTMTAPLLTKAESERWQFVPTGFLLLPRALITVHYSALESFDEVRRTLEGEGEGEGEGEAGLSSRAVLVRLLEELVDRAADQFEAVSEMTTTISRTVFYADIDRRGLDQETKILRRSIIKLGRASDRASRMRYMILSIGRIATFVTDRCETALDERIRTRFHAIAHDIASLDEFEISLSARIQFLLDAATGLIGIRQNDVVKVLTVASVVGIPPVLVVGVYGMNFRAMPELAWPWGYPFALALCLLSGALPYLWFKWRKWV